METSLNETIQILRLRCTSNVRDSLSDWATHSSTWNSLDGLEKQRLMASRESDFEFFISLSDWLKTFTHLEIVHLDADTGTKKNFFKEIKTLLENKLFVYYHFVYFYSSR